MSDSIFHSFLAFSLPTQYIIAEDGSQVESDVKTWNDVFNIIKSEHWHKGEKHSCPHAESLYDHLCLCGKMSYEKAIELGYSEKECIKAYFSGLLHDLGKPGTRRTMGKYFHFKGHGVTGGALIENLWSTQFEDVFGLTKEDMGDISMVADVHMCGYFPDQTTDVHKFSFQILPESVKKMLVCVRHGDICSMTPSHDFKKSKEEIVREAIESEKPFIETLFLEPQYDAYLSKYNLNQGILIQMCGSSSTGKSTLANKIMTDLNSKGIKTIIVNRDSYMVKNSMAMMGKKFKVGDEITPELYNSCYSFYISKQKSYSGRINEDMKDSINQGLQQGWVVIVDTMMTMFPKVVGTILPDSITNAFKISIWVHRNTKITEDESLGRLGMSLEQQLSAYEGSKNVMNPFRDGLQWESLIAMTEKKDLSEVESHQSHLVFSFGRTGIKNHILADLYSKLEMIYKFNQSIWHVPLLEDTMHLDLSDLIGILHKNGGIDAIKSFFLLHAYRVIQPFKDTKYEDKVIGIKYIDGMNNIWKPKWSRQARGRFYFLGDEIIPLKDALQRGIEVLTKSHKDHGIQSTQDIDWKTIERVDDVQAETIMAFAGQNDYNGILTGKVDGSLLIVNHYPIDSVQYNIMKQIIEDIGDDFSKMICKYCVDNGLPLITVATQGTVLISSEMQDYFVTAIKSVIDFEFTDLLDSWARIIPTFCNKVLFYLELNGLKSKVLNMCFEAYCKDRRSLTGVLHTELAIGYDHNGFNLLGIMCDNNYIPHFDLKDVIFNQPVYLKISNTKQVFDIMDDMDKVVLDQMSYEDFMIKYFPEKIGYPIHMEGWVMLTPIVGGYDYSKIKTNLYYKCHKVREDNISELIKLPKSCQSYYPIIKILIDFYSNSEERLFASVKAIYDELVKSLTKDSVFYQALPDKARKRVDEFMMTPTEKNREVVFKILINNCQTEMIKVIMDVNKEIWSNNSDQLATFMKGLIMKVEPWKSNDGEKYPKLVQMIKDKDPYLNDLFNIFFNENA
jgi:hypothetical protein